MKYLKNERIWDMEITEGDPGPSGCVQNREMARAGARAEQSGQPRESPESTCSVFFIFILLFYHGHTPTHTPGHTPHIEEYVSKGRVHKAGFVSWRWICSGHITFPYFGNPVDWIVEIIPMDIKTLEG